MDADSRGSAASQRQPPKRRLLRRRIVALVVLVVLTGLVAALFVFVPGFVERSMNQVVDTELPEVGQRARQLHDDLVVVDLHADTLLWDRDLLQRAERGHVDLPRLEDGNVALQVFSSVTKSPWGLNYDSNPSDSDRITLLVVAQLQPLATWTSLLARSLYHADKLRDAARASKGRLRVITTADALRKLLADRRDGVEVTGAVLSIEGLHDLEGSIRNLERLHRAGFRMAGLVHFFDNRLGGSMHGERQGGLSPFGRDVVARMEELGMVVDVAHASPAVVNEVLQLATRPVVSSHGGVKATCDENRNLSDEQIRGIAKTGGVIGIGYWPAAVCDTSPRAVAAAIAHVRDVAGIDHVALGSDFDGAVSTGFDSSQLAVITQALIDHGFSEGDIRQVMGGNVVRVLSQTLPSH